MKLAVSLLVVLAVAVSAQRVPATDRVKQAMKIWATTIAHCREAGSGGAEVDKKKVRACKKCHSGVGNWFTEDGLERGMKCLEEFEPEVIKTCGETMKSLPENNFDQTIANKALACWENVNLRRIGEKCLKSTGGKNMLMASLCSMQHRRADHRFAEKVIFGEDEEEKGDPTKLSKLERAVETLMVDGRCIHANEGNTERTTDCITCFNYVMSEQEKMEKMEKKHKMHHMEMEGDHADTKKIWSMYAACSNVYLAPTYSDCFDQMDEILQTDPESWTTPAMKGTVEQLNGCFLLKQGAYWWKDCEAAAGEGIEGFMNYQKCARNTTISWVASRRPESVEMMELFMKGNEKSVDEGGLITSLV